MSGPTAHAASGRREFRALHRLRNPRRQGWDNRAVDQRVAAAMAGNYPVPGSLAWDLFLGVAPEVPYHPIYHPFNWRGWVDWGVRARSATWALT